MKLAQRRGMEERRYRHNTLQPAHRAAGPGFRKSNGLLDGVQSLVDEQAGQNQ
jgi:hypothetical protein